MSEALFNEWRRSDDTIVGAVIQVANYQTGAVATGTTTIPLDDTIPTSSEGTQFMTLSITPKSSTNKLKITVVFNFAINGAITGVVTLLKNSDVAAIAAMSQTVGSGNANGTTFTHYMTAGTTDAITFNVRAGPVTAATMTFNGRVGARDFGGVLASSITIEEIQSD